MDTLVIEGLHKSFGSNCVLNGLNLTVKKGSVFGFIGENGAGKTTTMKSVLGLLKPDAGSITVCGEKVSYGNTSTNRFTGYLPDVPAFYEYMSPAEYLALCGRISGMDRETVRKRTGTLLEMVGLGVNKKRIKGFSRGMKQRLGIAQALLAEPQLLICDEPTSALDPVGRKEILDILKQVSGETTVIFSTHILSDVERICDEVAFLHNGKNVLSGSLSQLKAKHGKDSLKVEFVFPSEALEFCSVAAAAGLSGRVEKNCMVINSDEIKRTEAQVLKLLASSDLLPVRIEIEEPTLEGLFLEVTK